ncbi:MAG: hypothetical protein SOV75_05255 [Candidatus Limiplasma sp.]|nr:hypothetical protein [Candidatus Limiplasma sp.]
MERLTKRELLGGHNIAYASGDDCFDVWSVPKKFMGNAIDRLAYIEDILGDNYDLSRLRDLVQADRDGRCVVLSEPMSPMVQIPGDTDVYCPNCAQTLSGGWPLSDAGDYRKMCQCPNCGQAIDDTKCEIVYEVTRGEKHG